MNAFLRTVGEYEGENSHVNIRVPLRFSEMKHLQIFKIDLWTRRIFLLNLFRVQITPWKSDWAMNN